MPCQLHCKVASEPTCILDQHDADGMGRTMVQKADEAGALIYMIGTRYRRIIKLAHDVQLGGPSVGGDSFALSLFAIFVGADVCGRAGAVISDSSRNSHCDKPRLSADISYYFVN